MEQYVDADAVAEYLKITRRQVLEMTRSGAFPGYPLGMGATRRMWRYRLSEIDAAVASCASTPPKSALSESSIASTIAAGSPRSQRRQL
jgi:predicted DNA-binding transcriptional regulator AlpA